jgi:hypothetical protein
MIFVRAVTSGAKLVSAALRAAAAEFDGHHNEIARFFHEPANARHRYYSMDPND